MGTTYLVTFNDPGLKYVRVRTCRDFGRLSEALKFLDTIDENLEPELEREYSVKEIAAADTVKKSYELGYINAKEGKPRLLQKEIKDTNFYYWAYCEGYAKAKYNL